MNFNYLGRTGMKVSRLCLGTMNFGVRTDEKEAFAIMDAAVDEGINFFDTANGYGSGTDGHCGRTEEIIGRWFAQGGGRRERVVLATKVYGKMNDDIDGPNDESGLSAYKIRRHLEGSLKRLQTDHLELYQMHHIDHHTSWEELWGVFEALVNQGKIDYVGSSNFGGRHLAYAQSAAEKRHFLGLVCEQHRYNLMCRLPELEVLPASKDLGLGFVPWSPLAGGMLGGKALQPLNGKTRTGREAAGMTEGQRHQLQAFADLCTNLGETPSNVALAWLLHNPVVTAPIIGPGTVEQLKQSLRATEIVLSIEVLKKLDTLFPGPGGAAPEAYSW